MTAQRFRKKLVEVWATQWLGTNESADELYEWTQRPSEMFQGAMRTQFMVLGEDDAYDAYRCYDDDMELVPGNPVEKLMEQGFTAVVWDHLHCAWVPLKTGQWIINGVQDEFYPCDADVMVATYDRVEVTDVVAGNPPEDDPYGPVEPGIGDPTHVDADDYSS